MFSNRIWGEPQQVTYYGRSDFVFTKIELFIVALQPGQNCERASQEGLHQSYRLISFQRICGLELIILITIIIIKSIEK